MLTGRRWSILSPIRQLTPLSRWLTKSAFHSATLISLLKSAIEKYGEPSVSDAQRGRYIWCKALAEKTNKCDDSKSELTLTTREVEDTGILTLSDPTVSFDASRTATATPDKDRAATEDNQGHCHSSEVVRRCPASFCRITKPTEFVSRFLSEFYISV